MAQRAAVFQEELCVTILRGIRNHLRKDGKVSDGEVGVHEIMLTGDDEIRAFTATQCQGPLGAESSMT